MSHSRCSWCGGQIYLGQQLEKELDRGSKEIRDYHAVCWLERERQQKDKDCTAEGCAVEDDDD